MKTLFILGRNPELSLAELYSYFGEFNFIKNKNGILTDLKLEINKGIIEEFGGVISIGDVYAQGNKKEVFDKLDEMILYRGENNKINYVVWNFSEDEEAYSEFSNYVKKRFKKEKLKATEKRFSGKIKLQGKNKEIENLQAKKDLDSQFFVFQLPEIEGQDQFAFGEITQTYSAEETEKRDMDKPVRRSSLSISPRLAKIMINLSQVKQKENKILLDPFCGIGVVLEEALNQGIKVVGVDKDRTALEGAKENLKWFGFSEDNFGFVHKDSAKVKLTKKYSAIVTEPHLGEILKKMPNEKKAKFMLNNFEDLIINVLNNLKNTLDEKDRVVFTSPFIRTIKKRVGIDGDKVLKKTGLKKVVISKTHELNNPIPEFRKNQIVGREIFVFEV